MPIDIWERVLSSVTLFQPQGPEASANELEKTQRESDIPKTTPPAPKEPLPDVIGREDEIKAFDAYLGKAWRGQGSMLLFNGGDGSGKTYLLKKMRDRALKEKVPAFYGRTTGSAASDPYQPIFSALGLGFDTQGHIIQVSLVTKATDAWAIDTMKLAIDLTRDILRLAPVVGQIVSVGTLVTKIGKYVYQNRQRSQSEGSIGTNPTFEALRRRLGEMMGIGRGNPRPLVLLIDDLQLAQETTFRLLDYLLSPDWPLLIVATWNGETGRVPLLVSDTIARMSGQIMPLRSLTTDESRQLALLLANKSNFEPGIKKLITDNADTLAKLSAGEVGIVMAGVEYLAQGRDPGLLGQLLEGSGEGRIAAGGTGGAALLHALAGQQIEQLPAEAQDLLACAALLGDSFPTDVLTQPEMLRYLGMSERAVLRTLLSQAEARRIVMEVPEEPGQLLFTSAVTRQLLLRRVPRSLIKRDHRIIAAAWQDALGLDAPDGSGADEPQQSPDEQVRREQKLLAQAETSVQAPPEALRLANHFSEAGDPLLALYYSRLSGRTLLERRAYPEAQAALEKALGYIEALPVLADTDALALRKTERVALLQAIAFVEEARSLLQEAVARLEEALLVAESGEQKEYQGDILAQLGWVRFKMDDIEGAKRDLSRAHELAQMIGDNDGMARTDYYLGSVFSQAREYARAVAAFERCLQASKEAGADDSDRDLVLLELGQVYIRLKRYEEASQFIEQGLQLANSQQDDFARVLGLRYRGRLWLEERKVEALDTLREAQTLARETLRDAYMESTIINTLALALERFNQMDEARAAYMEALPILERTGNSYGLGAAYGGLGRLALNRGRYDEASEYLRRDLEMVLRAPDPAPVLVSQLLTSLARAARGAGNKELSAKTIAQSVEVAAHVVDPKARRETLGYAHMEAGWQALDGDKKEEADRYATQAAGELSSYPPAQAEVNLLDAAVACSAGRIGEAITVLRKNLHSLAHMPEGATDLYIAALTHLQIAELCTQGPTDDTDPDARPWAERALQIADNLGNEDLSRRAHNILDELDLQEKGTQAASTK